MKTITVSKRKLLEPFAVVQPSLFFPYFYFNERIYEYGDKVDDLMEKCRFQASILMEKCINGV